MQTTHVEPTIRKRNTMIFFIIGITALVIGISFGPFAWNAYTSSRTHRSGVETTATIIKIEDTGSRHNDNPVVRLTLQVKQLNTTPLETSVTLPMSVVQLIKIHEGMDVPVMFDKDHPDWTTLLP